MNIESNNLLRIQTSRMSMFRGLYVQDFSFLKFEGKYLKLVQSFEKLQKLTKKKNKKIANYIIYKHIKQTNLLFKI